MTTPFMTTPADCVLLAQLPPYEPLRRKLERAVVVSSAAVPADQPERALRRRSVDERLDEGLELTYPASDPLAVSP